MKKTWIVLTSIFLFVGLLSCSPRFDIYAKYDDELSYFLRDTTLEQNQAIEQTSRQDDNYYTYHQDNLDRYSLATSDLVFDVNDLGGSGDAITLSQGDVLELDITLTYSQLYQVYLDYQVSDTSTMVPVVAITINDEQPFREANYIPLDVNWVSESTIQYDRYGDELTPRSFLSEEWYEAQGLLDPNRFFVEPLYFLLPEGNTTLSIHLLEGDIHVKQVLLASSTNTYEEYVSPSDTPSSDHLITIEAEDVTLKSRQSIRAKYVRDPQVTPYEYKNRVLNVLDGYSFGQVGDEVTYSFTVDSSGYYYIGLKYLQQMNPGLSTFKEIKIDGVTPYRSLMQYPFTPNSRWDNEVLSNDGEEMLFYFDEGTHTITLSTNSAIMRDVYHDLVQILSIMETIGKDVKRITGGLEDDEREWNISNYIPTLTDDLQYLHEELTSVITAVQEIEQTTENPIVDELEIALKLIDEFIEEPDEIASRMDSFNDGEASAYSRINTVLPMMLYHPLELDKIYVFQEVTLPRANANLFVRLFEGIKSFTYSFFDPKYNEASEIDDDTIEIWVNKSRLYVEIMQRMIDEDFTKDTGIKVQLNIMPDENKIILSNAASTTPDGVIGITFQKPFEFALRDMLVDLRQQEGFYDLASEFNPNSFIPYIFEDGVYAIPETQDVKLLIYRKDVLDELNLDPPDTWQDVIAMVPVLRKYGMNFYVPIGDANAFKGTDKTTPFIYQFGGTLYDQETLTTSLHVEQSYQAFEFMTELFTVYNLPVSTANFFQSFRSGTVPVGIGDANTYIQLKYAAPELAGQWGVLPIPGIENEDGIVERWDPTYGSSSIVFQDSAHIEDTWNLISWWSSKEVQARFSYNIQSTLGNRFLYMTANIEGFQLSAWPSDTKATILEQWNWIETTARVPGDYMLERELSNAWNRVVFSGVHPRVAIDEATIQINLELARKLREFGYMDENGTILRPFLIPTRQNIEEWLISDE